MFTFITWSNVMLIRCLAVLSFAVLAVGLAHAAAPQTDDGKNIQGTWTAIAARQSGKPAPDEILKQMVIKLTKDAFILGTKEKEKSMKYRLDPTKKPREIDVSDAGIEIPGIYELTNDDLKICINTSGARNKSDKAVPRPTTFKGDEEGHVVLVLKRSK